MSTKTRRRWLAGPVLVVGSVVLITSGCGQAGTTGGLCAPDLTAKAEALQGAVDALISVSADMKAKLAVACAGMAGIWGRCPPPWAMAPACPTLR